MYQPQTYAGALAFMLGSMICWGSWANTLKLTPGWPFQLFYWDYVIGVIGGGFLWGFSLGTWGHGGLSFAADLVQADRAHLLLALGGGAVFKVANLLLVAAIEIAGLAIAFPIGIGLALVIGVLLNYLLQPKGNALLLTGGVLLVVLAIGTSLSSEGGGALGRIEARRAYQHRLRSSHGIVLPAGGGGDER